MSTHHLPTTPKISSFKNPYPSPISPPIINHHASQPIINRYLKDPIQHEIRTDSQLDRPSTSSSLTNSDYSISSSHLRVSQVRKQWLSMLHAVLTGDILRKETQRLFNTSIWTDPDEKHALWIALKAVGHGNSVYQEMNWIKSQQVNINRFIDEFMSFTLDRDLPFDVIETKVSTLLDRFDSFLQLYPTEKAFCADNPRWRLPECHGKLSIFQTWLNLIGELSVSIEIFHRWFDSGTSGVKDVNLARFSTSLDGKPRESLLLSKKPLFSEPDTLVLRNITAKKFTSTLELNPCKILDSLVRGNDAQLPIERRFAQELPRYLKRLKSNIIQFASQFERYNLRIPFDTISKLAELPLRVVQELHTIRLTYSEKIQVDTPGLADQLLSDFKVTLVIGMKARQNFLDFFQGQTFWTIPSSCAGKTFERDLFRVVKQYFRLLEKSLLQKQPGTKEVEFLVQEWHFCSSLLCTDDPVNGLDIFMADSFCFMFTRRFEHLRQVFLDVVEGSERLELQLDSLKFKSRCGKRFFSLLISHLCRVVPIVLDREIWPGFGPTSPNYLQNAEHSFSAPITSCTAQKSEVNTLSLLKKRPSYTSLEIFVQKLFDSGYHLLGHANEDVYFFSRNSALNVLDFICALPCNPQSSTWSSILIVVHFPSAPKSLTESAFLSPRFISDHGVGFCSDLMTKSQSDQFEKSYEIQNSYRSSLSPSEMISPILMIGSCSNTVLSACTEFHEVVPIKFRSRAMAFTQRTQLAILKLELCISRFAFSLLNGTIMIKHRENYLSTQALYSFVSDFSLRLCRISKSRRLLHCLLIYTVDWIKFTCVVSPSSQLKQSNCRTYRWALRSLEYVLDLCRMGELLNSEQSNLPDGAVRGGKVDARIIDILTDNEFNVLQAAVSHCMALLISHFESFSPNLKDATETETLFSPHFFAATGSKMEELETKRASSMRANRLIGSVLDRSASERSLASLSSSPSSISIRWQSVYLGINLSTGDLMAVKEIRIHNSANFASIKRMVSDEMKVMEQINHPHIIQYYGIEVHCDKVYIFMEYAPGGTLSDLVEEGGLDELVIRRFIYEILLGLQYLHSLKIVHRDIKPANILLDSQGQLKLVDFGASKILSNQETLYNLKPASLIGTPNYLAPELVLGSKEKNLGAQDIWSLGCLMYELYTGRVPWSHLDNQWSILYHSALSPPPIHDNFRASKEGLHFLNLCFTINPVDRPTATMLLAHPFLAEEVKTHKNRNNVKS